MIDSPAVETIAISKFKATCLAVLKRVKRTGEPILVTRFGEPIAQVAPPSAPAKRERKLGAMEGTMTILGDIISPACDEDEWEVLRD